jgi:phospholipase C
LPKIEHVVVLMLENRSFDCMLGYLYPKSEAFDGLDGSESNPWHRVDGSVEDVRVWNSAAIRPEAACIPNRELGDLFADINMQLYGLEPVQDGVPSMRGFVDNFMRQPPEDGRLPDPRAVMHCFKPAQVPVLSQLATAFGVSDRWHASAPCETWPNRYFAHAGTGGGYVNNEFLPLPRLNLRPLPTIYRRLEECGYTWKIYFHDVPQAATLADLWLKIPTHFSLFEDEFAEDARSGRLPNYSFIEPRYVASIWTHKVLNDQHPPHNILSGEQLIASVYNAVRNAPTWPRTFVDRCLRRTWRLLRPCAAARCGTAGRPLPRRVRVRPFWGARACRADFALCRTGQPHSAAAKVARSTDISVRPCLDYRHIAEAVRGGAADDTARRRRTGPAVRTDLGAA